MIKGSIEAKKKSKNSQLSQQRLSKLSLESSDAPVVKRIVSKLAPSKSNKKGRLIKEREKPKYEAFLQEIKNQNK